MLGTILLALVLPALAPQSQGEAAPGVPIRDLAFVAGIRANTVSGLGLVTGLQGTGDQSQATRQQIANMMSRFDFNFNPRDINARNAAIVMVSTELPPYAESGSRIDVTVSAVGDATSLLGGVLQKSVLLGDDGEVYALAQGPLVVGGFSASGEAATVQKNHTTTAIVPNGGIVETNVRMHPVDDQGRIKLVLRDAGFRTARRMAQAITGRFPGSAVATGPGSVLVTIPRQEFEARGVVPFLDEVLSLPVIPVVPARVVLNERTGTLVAGQTVRIAPVAIVQGNLTFTIRERPEVSQPAPFSSGETVVVPRSEVTVEEERKNLLVVEPGASVARVADALNALGVSPRDMMSLFLALKDAGALHAEVIRQ